MSIQTSKGEEFIWKKEHQVAFDELKCALMNSDALSFPRYDLPFYLVMDTSSKGICYMLYQKHYTNLKNIHVIRFGSKSLAKWQQSYGQQGSVSSGLSTAGSLSALGWHLDKESGTIICSSRFILNPQIKFLKNGKPPVINCSFQTFLQ